MIILQIILALFIFLIILTATEIIIAVKNKPVQELPKPEEADCYSTSVNGKSFEDLYLFLSGEGETVLSDDEIYALLFKQSEYMRKRFDCADFRAQLLFKIYKDCAEKLNDSCKELIKNTFLGFKFFMDEPGDDSMCYWSENHQILFAVSEYLAGQEWQNEIFTNDGNTGYAHMEKAKIRIDAWMKQRFNYGFSEYLSNNYLTEDIAPMANFIAYSKDKKATEQMKIIMDILWLDVALNSVNNRFVAASSRMYGNNKAGNFYGNSIQAAMNELWGKEIIKKILSNPLLSDDEKSKAEEALAKKPGHIVLCFTDIVKKGLYTLPPVISDIALTEECFISKMSCGLSPEDLEKEGLIGQHPYQIMAQLGAEAFTNPEVIENTIKYFKDNKMYRNSFVSYFRFLDLTVLRLVNWQKFAEKHNLLTHGIALGRGNIYTYRNAHYSLTTCVCKNVDMCGTQDHEWSANISENLALFTTHPSGNGNGRYGASPGYWIGNGRIPMSVQHENVNVTVYKLPDKKRGGEKALAKMTHAYMPREFYDEFCICENTVFARKNGVFVALITNGKPEFRPYNEDSAKGVHKVNDFNYKYPLNGEFDLCMYGGTYHIYITELSDADKESFEEFKSRIKSNIVDFSDDGKAHYKTISGVLDVSYDGDFNVNGEAQNMNFSRYDSKFCKAERKDEEITVKSENNTLTLDFGNAKRDSYCTENNTVRDK